MDELRVPVRYRDQEYELPLRVVANGYAWHFIVVVDGLDVIFERDDSGDFRAVVPQAQQLPGKLPEAGLLAAIAAVLQQL